MFDTKDEPAADPHQFEEVVRSTKLTKVLSEESITQMAEHYPAFIGALAHQYVREDKIKQFPFAIKYASAHLPSHMILFENEAEIMLNASSANLTHIAFFLISENKSTNKESLEFMRRSPSFWAFNPNKPSYSSFDKNRKIGRKVVTKNNRYQFEEACVVFKELSFDPIVECNHHNSISYFLKKAIVKGGLDICGMRLVYLDD